MTHSIASFCFLSFLLLIFTGCGGAQYAPVEGVVTLNGQPLADATVTFTPSGSVGNEIQQSFGRTDASGKYSLELLSGKQNGALIGNHSIVIAKNIETESDIMTKEEAKSVQLPKHDLTFEVKKGKNEANFDLDSKGKK